MTDYTVIVNINAYQKLFTCGISLVMLFLCNNALFLQYKKYKMFNTLFIFGKLTEVSSIITLYMRKFTKIKFYS